MLFRLILKITIVINIIIIIIYINSISSIELHLRVMLLIWKKQFNK